MNPRGSAGFQTGDGFRAQTKVRERTLKELGASASGILLMEQSTPRHKDLEAGNWMRAVRRAESKCHQAPGWQTEIIHQNPGGPLLLGRFRNEFVGDAKAVVVGMTANGFTLAGPNDRGMMDVVGFDATTPTAIADFVRSCGANGSRTPPEVKIYSVGGG